MHVCSIPRCQQACNSRTVVLLLAFDRCWLFRGCPVGCRQPFSTIAGLLLTCGRHTWTRWTAASGTLTTLGRTGATRRMVVLPSPHVWRSSSHAGHMWPEHGTVIGKCVRTMGTCRHRVFWTLRSERGCPASSRERHILSVWLLLPHFWTVRGSTRQGRTVVERQQPLLVSVAACTLGLVGWLLSGWARGPLAPQHLVISVTGSLVSGVGLMGLATL
jgi:hypothetical protein